MILPISLNHLIPEKLQLMIKQKDHVQKKSLVDDYSIIRSRCCNRYYESIRETLNDTHHWLTTRNFFIAEVQPILKNIIKLEDTRTGGKILPDILFEYLVIKSVTILEKQLQFYCNQFVQRFPQRAELLLKNRDKTKDLSIQILSNYSFSNLRDIKHVFSTLLGKDFFQILKHRSEEYKSSIGYENDHIHRASPLFKKWEMFEQLIQLRNDLVHKNKRIHIKLKNNRKNLLNTVYEVNYITSLEENNLPYNDDSFSEIRPEY